MDYKPPLDAGVIGTDSNGNVITGTLETFWQAELGGKDNADAGEKEGEEAEAAAEEGEDDLSKPSRDNWYKRGANYWMQIDPTVDGMLGGFGHVSKLDCDGSKAFLKKIRVKFGTVADCGGGIGRICKGLLLPLFRQVDLVEQCPAFVEQAKKEIKEKKLQNFFCVGLQDWQPEAGRYDVIWCQWVLSHLTDDDLVSFLIRCKAGLAKDGFVCIKENHVPRGEGFSMDRDDGSVTRTKKRFKELFAEAGYMLVKENLQQKFPKELFPVRMYALRPAPNPKN